MKTVEENKWIARGAWIVIGIAVLLLISVYTFMYKGCTMAVEEIEKKGLKGVVMEIWEGENYDKTGNEGKEMEN